ncbi:hypothetical protein WJX72_010259 [[Myrmecia] bisecta]|uniref:Bystin n=1 Tax=[Myrmecia] bisecta TaxID=41462 RepID=A0AAW1PPP5_9CHLO
MVQEKERERDRDREDGGKRVRRRREKPNVHRHGLGEVLENPWTYGIRTKPRGAQKRARPEEDDEQFLSGELSTKIMREARAQQQEVDAEDNPLGPSAQQATRRGGLAGSIQELDSDSDADEPQDYTDSDSLWDAGEEEVSLEDEKALAAFMAPNAENYQQRTLADIIMEKIKAKQEAGGLDAGPERDGQAAVSEGMDPKVVEVYEGVGKIMHRYTAGKMPKAFKIIPNLRNWEEVLYMTNPEGWSSHAVYQATRLFISNLNAKMAQRFLALVLLPHVREDIRQNHRLHFALFQAMKKAAYKPDAFYKGLLLPLCQSGTCTLREAVIFSSALKRVSIPVLHSAAALVRIADMEYSGTNSFFIRVLLDKKYALPYRVVDALVDHFMQFRREERTLPVVWHQALLCFVQRYKHEIRKEDKEALRKLMRVQYHYQVTPEIHRELDASRSRGERSDGPEAMQVQSRVGTHVTENVRDLPPVVMEED